VSWSGAIEAIRRGEALEHVVNVGIEADIPLKVAAAKSWSSVSVIGVTNVSTRKHASAERLMRGTVRGKYPRDRVVRHPRYDRAMPRTNREVLEAREAIAKVLGRRLASVRQNASLSQLDVARSLGVSQSQIAKLELGSRQLTFIEGLRLAELFDLAPEALDPRSPEMADPAIGDGAGL
jgi:DNA-binding XRE family transcriptional regulator